MFIEKKKLIKQANSIQKKKEQRLIKQTSVVEKKSMLKKKRVNEKTAYH